MNDSIFRSYQAWDDSYSDGKINSRPLFLSEDVDFQTGDTVKIYMHTVDKAMYKYFFTLDNATGSGVTASNPVSNISGGALGFFGAKSTRSKSLIIK